jgi:hypothetical protein
MYRASRFLAGFFLSLSLAAAPAGAQNLIGNPEFDSSIEGWFLDFSAAMNWIDYDVDLCTESGALEGISAQATPTSWGFTTRAMDQIPVTPGETVHLSVRFRAAGAFSCSIYLTYCTGPFNCGSSSQFLDSASGSTSWVTLEASHEIPAGVAIVLFGVSSSSPTGPFAIDLDSAYLGRAERIFSESFEVGETCRWSGTTPLL